MSSSINRCLSIPELLEQIVDAVAADYYVSFDSLCALATVSRDFSMYALDELWHDIEDLDSLTCVLPEGLVGHDDDGLKVRLADCIL